jgi:murein L,D-transpeptidase YafK
MELIGVTFARALVISAAVAGALAPVGWPVACFGEGAPALPEKATRELPAALLSLLQQKKMPKLSPILIRIFKEESELEVWKQTTTGRFEFLKLYPVCRWSGELGPKQHEGDYQAPEGFYAITPKLMNPNSSYYLAVNMGFPNAFDAANDRDGSFIMIHGNCASVGCYAMTDEQIAEIYGLARDAFLGGKPAFQVQAYPFRMTPENLARHRTNPNMPFWQMLKIGNDHFEATHLEPGVDVCDRRYVFDARPIPEASKPGSSTPGSSPSLAFGPADPCPAFAVDPKVAQPALEKQRADAAAYAQLVKDNVPTVSIHTGLDGGMNAVFHPPFPYNFISLAKVLLDGFVDLPPLQPVPYLDSYRLMAGP